MAILECMEEQKLDDGKKREKMFFSYAEDVDKELLGSVLANFSEHDDTIVYTVDPTVPASPELDEELKEMDDMMFFSSLSLYSEKPARTILHDIPYMIGQGILPFSVEQKGKKWQNLLDEIFLTLYHSKGEKELPLLEVKKLITEAIRVVTRDYQKEVPHEMLEPLFSSRLALCREIAEEDKSYPAKAVLISALLNRGNLQRIEKHTDDAVETLREAYKMSEALSAEHPSWDSHIFAAKASSILAHIYIDAEDERKAKRWLKRTVGQAEALKDRKEYKEHPEMPELDICYITALIQLSGMAERDGQLKEALDMLFKADLTIKDYPHLVPEEVTVTVGEHIDELATHVLRGIEG